MQTADISLKSINGWSLKQRRRVPFEAGTEISNCNADKFYVPEK
jgi:hypothetical protein